MFLIQLIVIQVITFIALMFSLKRIMFSSSVMETKRLQVLSEENIRKIRALEEKMCQADAQYEEKILKAQEEIKKAKLQAKEETEKVKESLLSQATVEAKQIVFRAMNMKNKIKEELEARLHEKSIEQAAVLIKNVLSGENWRFLQNNLVDEAIVEIEGVELSHLQIKVDEGEFVVPSPLAEAHKEKLADIFLKKTGRNIQWRETIDKEILGGVFIRLGSFVIDASLSTRLKEATENLKKI